MLFEGEAFVSGQKNCVPYITWCYLNGWMSEITFFGFGLKLVVFHYENQ